MNRLHASKAWKFKFRGFSLVELAVVMAVIGLMLFFMIPTNTTMLVTQRRANTIQKLAVIESALTNYIVVNKRLPCPADGSIDLTVTPLNALAGVEGGRTGLGDCTQNPANQASGVVPWVTLGLGLSDVLDAWDNQITFRVGFGLTRTAALDMSSCDPAGTAAELGGTPSPAINQGVCNAATCTGTFAAANCTSPTNFLQRKGLDVKSSTTTTAMSYLAGTGAAYVLISHGENGYGAISNTGAYRSAAMRGVAGTTLEDSNRNQSSLTIGTGAPPQFMSANYSNGEDATTYFDDIIVRPLVFSIISKAQLGPRTH